MPYSMKFAKKAKIEIKFQKMKDTFLDRIPWLKSHQPPLCKTYYEADQIPAKNLIFRVRFGGAGAKQIWVSRNKNSEISKKKKKKWRQESGRIIIS